MPIPADKGRKIVSSECMGFDEDPKEFLQESMVDLARVDNLRIWYKNIQAWDTRKDLMLLYCPTSLPMDVLADEVMELFTTCEHSKRRIQDSGLTQKRRGNFQHFIVSLIGQKEEYAAKNSNEDTFHMKVPTSMYSGVDKGRIIKVMRK